MIAAIRRRAEADTPQDDALRLDALVRESRDAGIARRCLLVSLSSLPRQVLLPHHLRLARDAVEPLAMADRARVFALPNQDLIVVWRGEAQAALAQSLDAVRLLFEDDAALLPDPALLTRVLTLPDDADRLLDIIDTSMRPDPFAATRPAAPGRKLDLGTLATIESALTSADISRMVRRRAVCSRGEAGALRLRWEIRLISIDELTDTLVPGTDITADPWLFRRLTRMLDRRMLALLAAPHELRGAGPLGLSLNVSSVLSPEFLRFDAALSSALRGQVVIGIAAGDLLSDPAAFIFARDFARARQYRLMLRGITAELIDVLPLRRTGLDLVELLWSRELALIDIDAMPLDLRRTVLTGVDTPEALAWATQHAPGFVAGRLALPEDRRRANS